MKVFKNAFSIVAVSETWINNEKGADFVLNGYNFHYISRESLTYGGVALFVDKGLSYKVIDKMSLVVDVIGC